MEEKNFSAFVFQYDGNLSRMELSMMMMRRRRRRLFIENHLKLTGNGFLRQRNHRIHVDVNLIASPINNSQSAYSSQDQSLIIFQDKYFSSSFNKNTWQFPWRSIVEQNICLINTSDDVKRYLAMIQLGITRGDAVEIRFHCSKFILFLSIRQNDETR